jgi:RNA polymerase sigma-70 factor, ECF subfamily
VGAMRLDKDASLVDRACAGDGSAFDALVIRYRTYVLGLATRLCRNREMAEDVCVEAFSEAYRALPRFRPQAAFRTWLHRIALNVCLEHLRHERTQRRYLPEAELAEDLSDAADTCELALTNTRAEQVQQAIEALPEHQKMTVCLFYLEERSCAEIAQLLHIPRNTVKTRLFYGTRALRELLAERPMMATTAARGGSYADL